MMRIARTFRLLVAAAALLSLASPAPAQRKGSVYEPPKRRSVDRYPALGGFIDRGGQTVTKVQFLWAGEFSEGLAPVLTRDRELGYIDTQGEFAIKPREDQYRSIGSFNDGLALVQLHDKEWRRLYLKWGKTDVQSMYCYINAQGDIVIRPKFQDPDSFSEGLASVGVAIPNEAGLTPKVLRGFIDKVGRMFISPQFEQTRDFSEGMAAVMKDGKWGFIDRTGDLVVEAKYVAAADFSEGLAAVALHQAWGFVDRKGKLVIAPQFMQVRGFSEGLAAVATKEAWGYIDKTGKFVIAPQFKLANSFSDGLASVQTGELKVRLGLRVDSIPKFSYIDPAGKVVIAGPFRVAATFSRGLAQVGQAILSDPNLPSAGAAGDQPWKPSAKVRIVTQWGYVDTKGNTVWKIVPDPTGQLGTIVSP